MSTVLVVAPHPDDETLGCGGTLLRHISDGDEVHWLIMSTITQELGFSQARVKERAKEIKKVADAYKFSSVKQANFVTTKLDIYAKSELISFVSEVVNTLLPEIIYIPYSNDAHSDHAEVFGAVAACTKSFRYPFIKKVRVYETLSETEFSIYQGNNCFRPNLWIDISEYLERKVEIMNMYVGEMGRHPFPRSEKNIRALATYRGATSGTNFAESFVSLIERIIK